MDLEYATVISRMYGGYNIRPGWEYPRSPYGAGAIRRALGNLGVFDAPARPDWIDPGYPPDPAIVATNTANNNAYQKSVELAQADNNFDQCAANAQNASSPEQYAQVMARCHGQEAQQSGPEAGDLPVTYYTPSKTAGASPYNPATLPSYTGYSPRVSFSTSTGDTGQLKPGNTWTIRITGAQAGVPVTVTGGQNGQSITTAMGTTDNAGNWEASGTIDASMIGNWTEQWTAGGTNAGSLAFTVVAASQAQQSQATGKPNANVPPGNALTPGDTGIDKTADKLAGAGAGTTPPPATDNTTLYLIAAAAAAFLLMGRK